VNPLAGMIKVIKTGEIHDSSVTEE